MSPALSRSGCPVCHLTYNAGEMPSRNKVIAGILFSLYFRTQGCNLARLGPTGSETARFSDLGRGNRLVGRLQVAKRVVSACLRFIRLRAKGLVDAPSP